MASIAWRFVFFANGNRSEIGASDVGGEKERGSGRSGHVRTEGKRDIWVKHTGDRRESVERIKKEKKGNPSRRENYTVYYYYITIIRRARMRGVLLLNRSWRPKKRGAAPAGRGERCREGAGDGWRRRRRARRKNARAVFGYYTAAAAAANG